MIAPGLAGALPAGAVPPVSLRRNVGWTLLGNFAYGGCQWAMLIAIAKLGTPEMVGEFALAFAVAAPVFMAANLNLRSVLATDAHGAYGFGDYLGLRVASAALATALVVALAAALYRGTAGVSLALVALAKAVEAVGDVYLGFLQRHERMSWVSRSLVLKGVAALVGLLAGLLLGGGLAWGLLGVALAWTASVAGYDVRRARRLARELGVARPGLRWDWPTQRRLAWLALPLGLAALLASLQTSIPRLFVERMLGARELGFFAAASYLLIVGARVLTALGEAASPRLATHHAAADRAAFRRLVLGMVGVAAAVGLAAQAVVLAFGEPLLALLYRPEYATQATVLLLLMVGATLGYVATVLGYAMTAARVLRPQPVILAVSCLATAAACVALVPTHGNAGAAVATCVGALVQLAGNARSARAAVRRLGAP
jgi:O-antigen/teichoic acid export membrane protein